MSPAGQHPIGRVVLPAIGDSVLQRNGDSVFAMRLHGRPRAVESPRRHQGDN